MHHSPLLSTAEELASWTRNWNVSLVPVASGAQVLLIDNVLPSRLANSWHHAMLASWDAAAPCRESGVCETAPACAWMYTTNDGGGNAKHRSVRNVEARRKRVQLQQQRGGFAYSKWELSGAHPLYTAAGALMETVEMRTAVGRALQAAYPTMGPVMPLGNVSDYFITAFDHGDFLSTHSDGNSGTAAFVFHLADAWQPERGGALSFSPGTVVKSTREFAPRFNRLMVFLTRPARAPHQVLPVRAAPRRTRRRLDDDEAAAAPGAAPVGRLLPQAGKAPRRRRRRAATAAAGGGGGRTTRLAAGSGIAQQQRRAVGDGGWLAVLVSQRVRRCRLISLDQARSMFVCCRLSHER